MLTIVPSFGLWDIFNKWKRDCCIEKLPIIKQLCRLKIIKTKKEVLTPWVIEQGGIALSCIKAGVKVHYLDAMFNSWGGDKNFRILHCFKSLYKFNRLKMYSKDSQEWIKEYSKSEIPGKIFLAKIVKEFIKKFLN